MNTVEAKEWLDKCYGICSPSSTIKYWFAEFRRGRTSTADAERSGRPKEAIIPEIIQQVRRMLLNDRKVKVREIAESIGISTGSVVTIMHQHLHMKKLLAMEFLRRYITMDETWVHHYVPQDKRQSAEWVGPDERPPKRVKQDRWAGK
ncbi:histone-lysine N-methyltransferase SETMAR-like, partial [Contarinia nasturtii]|uniref:histone-lysine N-methyltransferase SETMAR-like n=1 Tax=Contarinia nasturtii TaxID=265458 RepID=UPI0012D4740F